jgi:hypothetical protein
MTGGGEQAARRAERRREGETEGSVQERAACCNTGQLNGRLAIVIPRVLIER